MRITLPKIQIDRIYVLFSLQFPGRAKVGVSANVEARRRQIEYDLQARFGEHVRVRRLVSMPIITSAYNFETAIHSALRRMFFPTCATMRGTTGWTEWFWFLNPVTALVFFLLAKIAGIECAGALGWCTFFCFFIPLDFALFVLILACAEYAILAGLVWGAFKCLNLL